MMKTHPFPIDRMNTVNDYMELLPARAFAADSPGFGDEDPAGQAAAAARAEHPRPRRLAPTAL